MSEARPAAHDLVTRTWSAGAWSKSPDAVVTEEPLQLLLDGEPLSVVMRTPGHDVELALGLMYAEGVIRSASDVKLMRISIEAAESEASIDLDASLVESNHVDIHLATPAEKRPQRAMIASSACGVCGSLMIEDLRHGLAALPAGPSVSASLLPRLVDALRTGQGVFERTGGLHASGLFSAAGEMRYVREDVGRHNALDKIVGRSLLDGLLPLSNSVLVVSGRAGYEIVQKSIAAGIPILVAVGAPSSLAVALAREFNQTLAGFARGERFNVYSAPERLT